MGKLLLFVLFVLLAFWFWRRHRRPRGAGVPPPVPGAEDMVRCAQCGVHLPRSESVDEAGRHFCGEAHRLEYRARP